MDGLTRFTTGVIETVYGQEVERITRMGNKLYNITIAGLEAAVEGCPYQPKHSKLLALMRSAEGLGGGALKLTRAREQGGSWIKRKLLTKEAEILHEDAREWVKEQLQQDGGDVAACYRRLSAQTLFVSKCELEELYFAVDRINDNPADFIQVCVYVENEYLDRALFSSSSWSKPTSENELLAEVGEGSLAVHAAEAQRIRVRPTAYKLGAIVDVGLFVDEAEGLDRLEREATRKRRMQVTDMKTGATSMMSADELDPGWDALPFKMRRLFDDWRDSSAGRSGARFSDHWFVSLSDYLGYQNERSMNLIPQWTFPRKLAKVEARKGDEYDFTSSLDKLDRRVGVPFGWYFFMLHGNRVTDDAGLRMLKLAEADVIDLPEPDYQVLKRWQRRPYGF